MLALLPYIYDTWIGSSTACCEGDKEELKLFRRELPDILDELGQVDLAPLSLVDCQLLCTSRQETVSTSNCFEISEIVTKKISQVEH